MELHAPAEFNGAKLVGVFESGTSAWHEARAYSLGGSEIGTILGVNQWESALTLWAKKTGKIEVEPLTNWAVRFGQAFENPILELWQQEHPEYELLYRWVDVSDNTADGSLLTVKQKSYNMGTYQHCDFPYLHANPDALARDRQTGEWLIVEVKTARTSFEALPPNYEAQVRHYMAVMGIQRSVVVAVAGMTWQEFWVERDEFIEGMQLDAAKAFMDMVVNDIRPDFDGSDSTYETVRKIHPEIDDEEIEIDGGHLLVLAQIEADKANAKLNEAKSNVMALMGRAKYAYSEIEGNRYLVATRQARKDGLPYLLVNKKGIK